MLRPLLSPVTFLRSMMPKPFNKNVIVYDTMTDSDSTAVASHVISPTNPLGLSWTVDFATSGTLEILSNKAKCTAVSGGRLSVRLNVGNTNAVITGKFTPGVGFEQGGMLLRTTNNRNWWCAAARSGSNLFNIVECNSGTITVRASTAVTVSNGTEYTIIFSVSGDDFVATLNNGSRTTYSSSLFNTVTSHGFGGNINGANDQWDDVEITT